MATILPRLTRKPATFAGLFLAGLTFFGAAPPGFAPPGPAVAGAAVENPSCWKLTVTPDDTARQNGRDAFIEYVMFDSLGFSAEALAKLGFPSVTATEGPADSFAVTSTSEAHGEVVWAGAVVNGRLVGTMTWSRDGQVYTYHFAGGRFDPD